MSVCKGCGKQITWGRTSEGKNIPLDICGQGYEVVEVTVDDQKRPTNHILALGKKVYTSHFMTCPKRQEFSGRNRETPPPAPPPSEPEAAPDRGEEVPF